jgi:hypothetical protein
MGDAGEALIDAESRIQERMEELARERAERRDATARDPESLQALEGLRLARLDLERQQTATQHEARRAMLKQAIDEIDRRIATLQKTT